MADLAVGQGPVQQELGQLAVKVGLILEHLHQLQQVLEKLIIPAREGSWLGPGASWLVALGLGQRSAAGQGAGQEQEASFP